MGEEVSVAALLCQSHIRTSDGRVKDYALYAGDDGKTWKKIQSGTLPDTPVPQRIDLPAPVKARHLKLDALSLHKGTAMTLTEVEVYTK